MTSASTAGTATGVSVTAFPNDASALVQDGWGRAQVYADDAFTDAQSFIDSMATVGSSLTNIPDPVIIIPAIDHIISDFVLPDPPENPGIVASFPAAPADPVLTAISDLSLPSAPEFTASPAIIDLSFPAPTSLSETAPTAPTLNDVPIPDSPSLIIPEVPTMLSVNLPNAPTLVIQDFTAALTELAEPPAGTLTFIEPAYTSALLDGVKAFLLQWVNGAATGIAPAVEQAIWDRGRAREDIGSLRKMDEVRRVMAGRGFPLPPGALNTALLEAVQEGVDKNSTLNREVMIKQAEMEQQNRQFAITNTIQLEGQLLTYSNQVAQRAYEVANATLRAGIDLYQAVVSGYNARVQAFATRAQVWKQQIDAELTKLQVYQAELEGQKLIGELNVQQVEVYKARLQGVSSLVEVYKAQIEAANVRASINKTVIDGYVGQVQGYGEVVRAKSAEYEGYATRVKAEVSKVEVFAAEADAYKSQVDGYDALVRAKVAVQAAQIKIGQELPLETFKAKIQAFNGLVQGEAARIQAINGMYETDGRVFASIAQAEGTKAGAESEIFKAEAQYAIGAAGVQVEQAKIVINKLTTSVALLIEAIKAGAQVSAQLAASALSAVNLHGSISDSNNTSSSVSGSLQGSSSVSVSTTISG